MVRARDCATSSLGNLAVVTWGLGARNCDDIGFHTANMCTWVAAAMQLCYCNVF